MALDCCNTSKDLAKINKSGCATVEKWIETLRKCEILEPPDLLTLCRMSKDVLVAENSLRYVSSPVTVCGDIHGQFFDLQELFQIAGNAPDINFLFMGDYVDRGYHSLETICLLLALKVRYPSRVTILRGNHECRNVTQVYGFFDECLRKYDSGAAVWTAITDVFDYLPLAAMIDNDIICMHGGLSPSIERTDELIVMDRIQETPHEGPMADIMWSDPEDKMGWGISGRGCGHIWGPDISSFFLYTNDLKFISRAHQLVMNGYAWSHDKQVLTLFSAPNYCYRCGNEAAIMQVDDSQEQQFLTFDAVHQRPAYATQTRRLNPDYFL